MPSHPKRDKKLTRCKSCEWQGHWSTACQGCHKGDRYKPRPDISTARDKVLGSTLDSFQHSGGGSPVFQHSPHEADGKFPTFENQFPTSFPTSLPDGQEKDKIATFQHLSTSFQHYPPPTTISYGTLTNGILSVLFKGLDVHYTQIATILNEEPNKVNAILSRLVKDPIMPVSKYINEQGQPVKGRYIMDPEFKIELELLDAPLKFHNIRFYPRQTPISQHSGGERTPFSTLIQHLGSVSAPRGGGRVWRDEFLGRAIAFVNEGEVLWVEVGATQEPYGIPELWELVRYVTGKFGLDAFKFDWSMAFETNQDISPLTMVNGQIIEVWVAGELYRAYQKWEGKNGGQPTVRIEKGRVDSEGVNVLKAGTLATKEHIAAVIEKKATLGGMADRIEGAVNKLDNVQNDLKLISMLPEMVTRLAEAEARLAVATADVTKQDRMLLMSLRADIDWIMDKMGGRGKEPKPDITEPTEERPGGYA